MDVLVARQAIFDRHLNVFGYELLFRSCMTNAFDGSDGTLASSQVISNSFFNIGIETILGGTRGFINFPREMLVDGTALVLPRDTTVVEILESVEEDDEVKEACVKLKSQGYMIALDDFPRSNTVWLPAMADIIKVDFRAADPAEQQDLVRRYGHNGVRMLAEKVETQEEFECARRMGYMYFQGYFFARPVIMKGREIPGFKMNYLRILQEVHRPDLEFHRLEQLLKLEVSLSYKLMHYINSATFGFTRRVESIKEALVLVGQSEIRKWISLVVMPELAGNRPAELVLTAVVRARFCELIARTAGATSRAPELFLMGLFSMLDVMMDRPLEELLDRIGLASDVRAALLDRSGPENPLADVYALVRAIERAEWNAVNLIAARLGAPNETVAETYCEAVRWADQVFRPPERRQPAPAAKRDPVTVR